MTNGRQLYAELPADLLDADDILRRYGRWARSGAGPARCGSAEGAYRAPQNDDDRAAGDGVMTGNDVARVHRALADMPPMTRLVLQWLYVKPPAPGLLRRHEIQPKHMRERHREGVALFWSNWRRLAPMTKSTVAKSAVVV